MTNWQPPAKRIYEEDDLKSFRVSLSYARIYETIFKVVEKVSGIDVKSNILDMSLVTKGDDVRKLVLDAPIIELLLDISDTRPKNLVGILNILERLNQLIDETPPKEGPRRFGNLNCRVWHDKVSEEIDDLLRNNLSCKDDGYIVEARYYLSASFGSKMRLDYGTGHELSFVAFIGALIQIGILVLDEITGQDLLQIFAKYYDITKKLILVYNLEPAGSHGVWGLDDHFHFIYILGASEFVDNTLAPPVQQLLSPTNINYLKSTNLYANAVAFIFKIKSGPFKEHSPIIYDIHSSVSLWKKVLKGLLKMYEVEVLNKFPVVQHFWFGEGFYPWKDKNGINLPYKETLDQPITTAKTDQIPTNSSFMPMTSAPWARR